MSNEKLFEGIFQRKDPTSANKEKFLEALKNPTKGMMEAADNGLEME